MILPFILGMVRAKDAFSHSWQWTKEDNSTIEYVAILPSGSDFKNMDEAYDECINVHNMNLVTIGSTEEQELVYNELSKSVGDDATAFWISLKRGQGEEGDRTKPVSWRYPYGDSARRCILEKPTFWLDNGPDKDSEQNCVAMLFNFVWQETAGINNWKADLCSQNYNGAEGAAHGYICANQTEIPYCTEQFSSALGQMLTTFLLFFLLL